jgi:hypothetical protein
MPELTGAFFTDCINFADCPKCKAQPQSHCRTIRGRKAWPPHVERGVRFQLLHPEWASLNQLTPDQRERIESANRAKFRYGCEPMTPDELAQSLEASKTGVL